MFVLKAALVLESMIKHALQAREKDDFWVWQKFLEG